MAKRGRKSAADLTSVPVVALPASQRPLPLEHLSAAACAVWRDVVGAKPPDFFDRGSLGLLEAYCTALAEHRKIMAVIALLDPVEHINQFAKLTRLADAHAARVSQLGVRMRLSQSARIDQRSAARAVANQAGNFVRPPWERK